MNRDEYSTILQRVCGCHTVDPLFFAPFVHWRYTEYTYMATLYTRFLEVSEKYAEADALGVFGGEGYQTLTYAKLRDDIKKLASGMRARGIEKGDRVAFMLPNGPDWVTLDMACAALGVVNASVHTTYPFSYLKHICDNSGARWLVLGSDAYAKFKQDISALAVERIFVIGEVIEQGIVERFDRLRSIEARFEPSDIEDASPHAIIYTSGTTGMPKGVTLTHRNLLSNVDGATRAIVLNANDRFFSFLPASHAMERTAGCYAPLLSGCSVFYAHSKNTVIEDIKIAQPTVVVSVPRVFEKVYESVMKRVHAGSLVEKKLFYAALHLGSKKRSGKLLPHLRLCYDALDALAFKKVRAALGGHLRFTICGGSSLSSDIMQFFDDVGILILEGYGLTEASPIVSANSVAARRYKTVGKPLPGVSVHIAPDNEILVKGESVMKGYWRDPDATAEVIDPENWLHTGDLGALDADGFLSITGRKKEMIVLSTGKNVAPVPIEQELEVNPFIAQAMVYGDDQKHISAIIVPDLRALDAWCKEHAISFELPGVFEYSEVQELFEHEIRSQLNHFPEIEQVRVFRLVSEEFTQENDLLTPTLKLKRKNILKRFG